jgi:diaminopimelate epimerase
VDGCGDGIRSVATYLCEQGRARESPLTIESARGLWNVEVEGRGPSSERVRIDMGTPTLAADRIPTRFPGNPPLEIPMTWPDTMHNVTCIGIGDPHAVIFVRDLTEELVQGIGPAVAHHSFFPLKTNVGFVRVNRRDDVTVRVWGRAGGELPVSSSGACAVVVAGVLAGRTGRQVTVHMPGGDLDVNWASQPDEHIYLTGPGAVIADSE